MGNLFRDLKTSSDRLGATVAAVQAVSIPKTPTFDWTKDLEESQERMAREREEDRERALVTSQTTAQSAELLRTLVDTAGIFMQKMDERDFKNDKQIRV